MSDVQRFDKDMDGEMEPVADGEWVRYSDYRKAQEAQPPCGTDGASRARDLLKIFGYDHYTPHMVCIPADKWAEAMALLGSKMIEQKEAQGSVYMPGCPVCGNPEIDSATARTVYSCGSSDYDQRPGTFKQSRDCTLISAQSALAASQREGGGT